jgi:hypothetical protein
MHFFYVDESGDTGANLEDPDQPIIVLGGISVRDEGWNATQEVLNRRLSAFFHGNLLADFELHAKDLLSPNGDGFFDGMPIEERCALCLDLLDLLTQRSHGAHYIAIDKPQLRGAALETELGYDHAHPYLLGFDYLITYINWLVKERLGKSARGLIILDKKDYYHENIEMLMHNRRFKGPTAHRVKWVVEFGYSIDSKKNPMVQLSDLVIYCVKRFIEVEKGYRANWMQETKNFYARCYSLIKPRVARTNIVERTGRGMDQFNALLQSVKVEPRTQWRRHYNIG